MLIDTNSLGALKSRPPAMRYERDERGDVKPETVRMTVKEARRWLYRPDRQVPPHLLMEVKRH